MIQRSTSSSAGRTKFKVILLGDQSTGKTSIIQRFMHNKFSDRSNPTIGIDFLGKNISHKNKDYRLQLWDTAGQEKFRSLIPSYLRDAICVLYVFDLNNVDSLNNMQRWIQLFRQNKGAVTVSVLCGNKLDLDRNVDQKLIDKFLEKNKMPFYQISAKTGEKVDDMFLSIIDIINLELSKYKKFQKPENQTDYDLPPPTKQSLVPNKLSSSKKANGGKCCSYI